MEGCYGREIIDKQDHISDDFTRFANKRVQMSNPQMWLAMNVSNLKYAYFVLLDAFPRPMKFQSNLRKESLNGSGCTAS
jgi:hypothetical protein